MKNVSENHHEKYQAIISYQISHQCGQLLCNDSEFLKSRPDIIFLIITGDGHVPHLVESLWQLHLKVNMIWKQNHITHVCFEDIVKYVKKLFVKHLCWQKFEQKIVLTYLSQIAVCLSQTFSTSADYPYPGTGPEINNYMNWRNLNFAVQINLDYLRTMTTLWSEYSMQISFVSLNGSNRLVSDFKDTVLSCSCKARPTK